MFSLILGLPSTTSAADLSARLVRRLRRYYAPVRLLPGVPARCVLLAFRAGPAACLLLDTVEVSRFSRVQFLGVRKALSTTPGPAVACVRASAGLAFPWEVLGRHPGLSFRSSIPRPSMPLSTLHLAPHGTRRKTQGQDGSLLLSCGALSSPTARQFIPTLALPQLLLPAARFPLPLRRTAPFPRRTTQIGALSNAVSSRRIGV